jgi:oligopeptidase B
MKKILLPCLCLLFLGCEQKKDTTQSPPPVAKKIPETFKEHGQTRVDNYNWLSNPQDPAVIQHLENENAYVNAQLKHTEDLQEKIYGELVARIDPEFNSLPVKENGYWYYIRYEGGKQYPFYCRKKDNLTAKEEVYLNADALAEGHQIFLVRGAAVSPDNQWLAYGADTTGNRQIMVSFKNLATGKLATEQISNTAGYYAWANDNKTVYYTLNDPTVRSYKVMRHQLGTSPNQDQEIYTENDSTFSVGIRPSKDNRYIFISSESSTTSEVRYLDANNPKATATLIQPRQREMLYEVTDYEGDSFYLTTNKNAVNFKLVKTPIAKPGMANWQDVIPADNNALLQQAEVLQNFIVGQQKIKGLTQIKVINRQNNSSYYVEFAEPAYVANLSLATDAANLDSIRYSYTSLTTPNTHYYYHLATKQKKQLKQDKVGGGYDPQLYQTQRIWATATDGTEVPISLVYKKEAFEKDGTNPLLLYAYGSYGANSDPYFNPAVISLLDRGFVYAIAHIRGGQDLGRQWYDNGKMLQKKNTFTDFIACAQHLVDQKYTAPDKLFANGGSAGGMLMGAITNMRPDLFKGIIAEVPWMDVITDMLNASLPLTTLEYDEWGDPNQKKYYDYMRSWSPYDNLKKAEYPAILATGGLNDTQVPYFSPAKWVAKVRELNTGSNPVLFKVNMGAGHGGESGRFARQKLTALKYAFMLDQLGRADE